MEITTKEQFRKVLLTLMEREEFKAIHEKLAQDSSVHKIYKEMLQEYYMSKFGFSDADREKLDNLIRFTEKVKGGQ